MNYEHKDSLSSNSFQAQAQMKIESYYILLSLCLFYHFYCTVIIYMIITFSDL
jgi:hypothetical protein